MLLDPGMIERRVVGDEVEHQPQPALSQPLAQAGQRGIAAQIAMHGVAGDGETGAGDVFLAQVGQRLLRIRVRHSGLLREIACAAGPVCQTLSSQTQSKPISARRSSSASGMSSSVARRPSVCGQLGQPDAGIDLVERQDSEVGMAAP